MFVFYSILIAPFLCLFDLLFFKNFQLEGYKIDKYIKNMHKINFSNKTPLVFTHRVLRLFAGNFVIKLLILLLFFGFVRVFWADFVFIICMLIFSPMIVVATFAIMQPIENLIKKRFIQKAKKKLKSCVCKTVAITGSYGKTSTKNILYQILKQDFDVCASPKSFNTPMGVCKTILEQLKETDDFLIVEFGARRLGDIDELAKMVGVDFGIITPLGSCHLETFGSLENIENAKFELCENTKNAVVFNGKSKGSQKLYERFDRKKYLVCKEGSFAYAKDVVCKSGGSSFTLVLDGKTLSCSTNLLGKSNIDNIVVAAAMAYVLGQSMYGIKKGIENLQPTAHRLELIKGFSNVIDDSYNSNFDGFIQALEVLSSFEGRKIVVSPGIVELGKAQYDTNKKVAQEVSRVADIFVIMNETNKTALTDGAMMSKKQPKIFYANTRTQQKELLKNIIKKGDVVLFENDLPDNFR